MKRFSASSEGGYTLIMVAICLFLLMAAAAFAVDLSAIRQDRAADQKVTDSAAAAGALAKAKSGPVEGCEAALAYVAANTPGLSESDLNLGACNQYSQYQNNCSDTSLATEFSQTAGSFEITYVYPVPDTHALMNTGLMGGGSQAIVPKDGLACERVAVQVTSNYNATFARVLGMTAGPTTVHTVAMASRDLRGDTPLNLLVLDRFGCNAIRVEGNAGIIVNAVFSPNAGGDGVPGLVTGVVAADSDGSASCTSEGVIHLQGTNTMLRADGPAGCTNQSFPPPYGGTELVSGFLKGYGCGEVRTMAPGSPGCNLPACSRTGSNQEYRPNPFPTQMTKRLTRAPVDYRYNCKADYTTIPGSISWATWALTTGNQQDIPPCEDATSTTDHIDELIERVGPNPNTPAGFTRWQAAGHPCNVGSTIEVTGDWFVDCPTLSVTGTMRISGNAVFQGSITLGSSGRFEVINTAGSPGFAFMRNGVLNKAGQSHVGFYYTMVYASKTFRISLSGGTGSLNWIAPAIGDFDDLALWSDFVTPENTICSATPTNCNNWAGQAALRMEGLFFSPLATADYSGTSGQNLSGAQWIADKLNVRGGGILEVAPTDDRQVLFPPPPGTILIR